MFGDENSESLAFLDDSEDMEYKDSFNSSQEMASQDTSSALSLCRKRLPKKQTTGSRDRGNDNQSDGRVNNPHKRAAREAAVLLSMEVESGREESPWRGSQMKQRAAPPRSTARVSHAADSDAGVCLSQVGARGVTGRPVESLQALAPPAASPAKKKARNKLGLSRRR
jgi:hypothetical protein